MEDHRRDTEEQQQQQPAGRCRAREKNVAASARALISSRWLAEEMRQYHYRPVYLRRRAECHVVPVMLSWVSSGSSAALLDLDHGRQA